MNKALLAVGVTLLVLAGLSLLGMLGSLMISFLVTANIIGSGGHYSWMRKFLGMDGWQYVGLAWTFLIGICLTGISGAALLFWYNSRQDAANEARVTNPSR